MTVATGCQSHVPFYRSGEGRGGPVFGLGGPAPYVSLVQPEARNPPVRGVASREAARIPDIYAATAQGMLSPAVQRFPARVYVPNYTSGTIDVIDQKTFRIVSHLKVGRRPQLVIPSWDLRRLWISDTSTDTLLPLDPRTARRGKTIKVPDPLDLYFTPDGRTALVMTGRRNRIDFRDPKTLKLQHSLKVPCSGVGHADFSANTIIVSCALSGHLARINPTTRKVTGLLSTGRGSMPRDVRLSPDGALLYVTDTKRGGVWVIDATKFQNIGFIKTGAGAHSLFPSRDARTLYVSNSQNDTVSLIDFSTRRVTKTWRLPRGGSPEMGGVSADGTTLWLSGRGKGVVYAISTKTGRLLRTIKVGKGPYGLCVYPQPGRYSLGHTGLFR